ncbi:Protein inturned [Lucilia cuprina]|uniref:Protein inturned n=1 Tax=Lucilia cuprina TaxID=7375 RepID=A0A0L0CIZ7_LUCCU|nr:Protein inturned [Lucilia cuprina]KNC32226.1 Protein inturned [Lucilia cuprina]
MRRSQEYQTIKDNSTCINVDVGSESYSSESDSGSADDSYTDGSDMANWEEFVSEDGSLFYVEYMPKDLSKLQTEGKVEFMRNSLRMAKKSSRRQQAGLKATETTDDKNKNPFMFANIATTEEASKCLELVITAADRFRFGRRSTAVESILGFHVVPFADQPECLMVDSFVHDMPALFQQGNLKPVSRGDWFKTLDDIEIRASNIDDLLLQFVEPTKVCLKFQGPLKNEQDADNNNGGAESSNEVKKIENFKKFSEMFEKLQHLNDQPQTSQSTEAGMNFGMLILPPECYQNDEHKNSLYFYPEDPLNNFLYKARGSFLTLNAVLTEEMKTKPSASKLAFDNVQYFVYYRNLNGFLVLFSYPCKMVNISEGNLRADELLSYIKLMFPNMNLDNFKNPDFRQFMLNFCEIQRVRLLLKVEKKGVVTPLEDVLKESRHLPLPKEAQLRIFDALSEMEAMDYRNWNDEPLHTHREFFIYGSVLYYDQFMLASQMPLDMRHHIEVFMRCRGIFDFVSKHSTKELYVWEEILLPDNQGRYFLAICGRGHLILAVILKIFTTPDTEEKEKVVPSLFYIEEIQETLDHLVQCGIESLAMFWSLSNKRPEILEASILEEESQTKEVKKTDTATLIKQKLHVSTSQTGNAKESHSNSNNYTRSVSYEEDNQPGSSLGGSSVHSLTPSEDDSSKKRLITSANNEASDDSGSDWENFMDENLLHCSGTDVQLQTQVTESLWKEISNVVPVKISAGWKNNIYYYVYVDGTNNSVFCPLKSSKETFPFTSEMYMAFHTIHRVLQKAKHSKRTDANRQTNGKDFVAVKEHGMTISVRDAKSSEGKLFSFVAVGRLFLSPPKEVYICHRPDIPQNMVEMAFRLSFFSLG